MNTLLDYFQRHTDGSFAAAVRIVREHAARCITPRMMQRLEYIVLYHEAAGEYEWGKVLGAMEGAQAPALGAVEQTPPPPPRRGGAVGGVEVRRLHKQHSHYHALLVSATTDAERAEYARKIMVEIIPALDAYYDAVRGGTAAAEAQDFDPIPVAGGAVGGIDLIRRLQSLRTRVSKITRHLLPAAGTRARRADLEKELELKRAEIARIEADLNT